MNSKILKGIAVLGVIFGAYACDDGKYNDLDCDPATFYNECLDETAFAWCNNGKMEVTSCGSDSSCDDTHAPVVDAAGNPVLCFLKSGSVPEVVPSPDVPDVCRAGEKVCDGNTVMSCQYGQLVKERTCAGGCENGACKPSSGTNVCQDSQTVCDGKRVKTCRGGAWVVTQTCEETCSNGACTAPAAQ